MTRLSRAQICFSTNSLILLAILFCCSVLSPRQTQAQNLSGTTPLAVAPGSPSGSYALNGFESVTPYSGNLSFSLPLLKVGGRGTASSTVNLNIYRKWRVAGPPEFRYPESGWWLDEGSYVGYGPGRLDGRAAGEFPNECFANTYINAQTLTRFTFTAADGTEFELRDQASNGAVWQQGCSLNQHSRGTIFVTADGSSATFISDGPVYDPLFSGSEGPIGANGILKLKDGTTYRIDGKLHYLDP